MMASAILFDNSGGSSSSSTMLESVELRSRNKNHQVATDPWRQESPTNNGRIPLIEHVVKNGETLMQISLLYSVPVSEIKRVNNIVADQEIHGLPVVKVPVSRQFMLKRQLMESGGMDGQIITFGDEQQSTSAAGTINKDVGATRKVGGIDGGAGSTSQQQYGKQWDKIPLLDDQDQNLHASNESLSSGGGARARQAIEGILDDTDRTVAAVRQNLPSPTLEGGAFHFVDAGAPDTSSNIWLIVAIVVIMFVLLPLGLTFLEETGELEEHHQQQANDAAGHHMGGGAQLHS